MFELIPSTGMFARGSTIASPGGDSVGNSGDSGLSDGAGVTNAATLKKVSKQKANVISLAATHHMAPLQAAQVQVLGPSCTKSSPPGWVGALFRPWLARDEAFERVLLWPAAAWVTQPSHF